MPRFWWKLWANFKIYKERQKAKNSKNYAEEEKTFLDTMKYEALY